MVFQIIESIIFEWGGDEYKTFAPAQRGAAPCHPPRRATAGIYSIDALWNQLEYFMGLDFIVAWHKEWEISTQKFIMRETNEKVQKYYYERNIFKPDHFSCVFDLFENSFPC